MKGCSKCKIKPRYKETTPMCKECLKISDTASRFKISFKYAKYLREQIECEACTLPFKNGKDRHIDHDHSTGQIRGVLCRKCNVALGFVDDNTQKLKNLIKYLEKQIYYENTIE